MSGALEGVRVLELGVLIAGPLQGAPTEWGRDRLLAERDAAEVDRLVNDNDVVCGPVYTIADIFEDPRYRARDLLVEMADPELGGIEAPGVVPRLSETPGELRWTGPWQLGRHDDDIYGGLLGLAESELGSLAEEGVI
jgi:crotonobetainyl-CoA:carnitine CoA-transferase CaiB-like acyl-CoA transferase